jgi:hypothetical protein
MNKLGDLDRLIEEVLGIKPRGPTIKEATKDAPSQFSSDEAIPAVPYPKLQLTDNWGKSTGAGFDVKLFNLAGLGRTGSIEDRLERLSALVDCGEACPSKVQEIIARLSIMEMFSTVMTSYTESSKGYLFENFMALVLKGSRIGGQTIVDIEIIQDDQDSVATVPVSLKLLRPKAAITGSLKNLYKSVMVNGIPIMYIIGYKLKDGSAVELWHLMIDQKFFMQEQINTSKETLSLLWNKLDQGEKGGKPQFTISRDTIFSKGRKMGSVPIYKREALKKKAQQLTNNMSQTVTDIYENLNLFSQQLTKFYIESDQAAGAMANTAFTKLQIAVKKEESLK